LAIFFTDAFAVVGFLAALTALFAGRLALGRFVFAAFAFDGFAAFFFLPADLAPRGGAALRLAAAFFVRAVFGLRMITPVGIG
jgi:hypothetical protein